MRCSDCGRALSKAALSIPTRGPALVFGPVCAKRYIVAPTRTLVPVPMRLPRVRPVVDESQLPLELEFA